MLSKKGRRRSGMIAFLALLVAWPPFFIAGAAAAAKPQGVPKPALVERAPDFVLTDLEGRRFRLGDFRNRQPVLIIFGTTWCPACREKIPQFKALHSSYAKEGLVVVNVNLQESREKASRFAAKHALPYPVLPDEDGAVGGIYDIQGVPSLVLVDRAGHIVCRQCPNIEPLLKKALQTR